MEWMTRCTICGVPGKRRLWSGSRLGSCSRALKVSNVVSATSFGGGCPASPSPIACRRCGERVFRLRRFGRTGLRRPWLTWTLWRPDFGTGGWAITGLTLAFSSSTSMPMVIMSWMKILLMMLVDRLKVKDVSSLMGRKSEPTSRGGGGHPWRQRETGESPGPSTGPGTVVSPREVLGRAVRALLPRQPVLDPPSRTTAPPTKAAPASRPGRTAEEPAGPKPPGASSLTWSLACSGVLQRHRRPRDAGQCSREGKKLPDAAIRPVSFAMVLDTLSRALEGLPDPRRRRVVGILGQAERAPGCCGSLTGQMLEALLVTFEPLDAPRSRPELGGTLLRLTSL